MSKINIISEKSSFSVTLAFLLKCQSKIWLCDALKKTSKNNFHFGYHYFGIIFLCCIVYGAALAKCPIEILQKSSDFQFLNKTQPKRENPTIFANLTAQALLHIWGRHYKYVICSLVLQKVCGTPCTFVKPVKRCYKLVESKSSCNFFKHDFRVPLYG